MSDEEFNKRYVGSTKTKAVSDDALTKKPENLGDVIKGIKATWDDPQSRKKILRKAFFKNLGE